MNTLGQQARDTALICVGVGLVNYKICGGACTFYTNDVAGGCVASESNYVPNAGFNSASYAGYAG